MKKAILFLLVIQLTVSGSLLAQSPNWPRDTYLTIQKGIASYYGKRFHKRRTASGEIFDMNRFTAAHKYLPFGTLLKVTNQNNGYQVIVKINDRLPQSSKRIIDLSRTAADRIDMIGTGIAEVKLDVLSHNAITDLMEYFEEIPPDIRLRFYHEPIYLVKNEEELFRNRLYPKN